MDHLQVAYRTDVGRRLEPNEDAIVVRPLVVDGRSAGHLLAVADGVGGVAGGEIASRCAVEALAESAAQPGFSLDPAEGLRRGFQHANARVLELSLRKPDLTGMATTLVAAAVLDSRVWLANAGDSRAYLVGEGVIRALTTDHSWVSEQVLAGRMTREEAIHHPRRNIITRALGHDPEMEPDVYEAFALATGDVLLLCSDGLHAVVPEDVVAAVVSSRPPKEAVSELVRQAIDRGGPDNISVIVARPHSGNALPDHDAETVRLYPPEA